MKSGILTILRKELARFFGDRRMAFTTILLPGLLIYIVYSLMGGAIGNMFSVDDEYKPSISVVNLPASIEAAAKEAGLEMEPIDESGLEGAKQKVENKELDICLVFPSDFDSAVAAYDSAAGKAAPNVGVYYNTADTHSSAAYSMVTGLLDRYESLMSNKFDVNSGEETYDLATKKDTAATLFTSMMPMLLMIFLFSGCMAVAPESIAGEKERGTIATMLITPMKRSDLAIGKISALAVIALLSGLSSALGTILALPKLMQGAGDFNAGVYSVTDYLLLGVVILSTVLLMVTLISLISAYARTIKEAQTAVTPLMLVVMLLGVTAMFGSGVKQAVVYYMIPLYNSVQCMVGVFSFDFSPLNILITVVSNLIYTGIGVYALTKMFNSERIVFSK